MPVAVPVGEGPAAPRVSQPFSTTRVYSARVRRARAGSAEIDEGLLELEGLEIEELGMEVLEMKRRRVRCRRRRGELNVRVVREKRICGDFAWVSGWIKSE